MNNITRYPNTTIIVDGGSCGGSDADFAAWLESRHPEIDVQHLPNQDGGGGHFAEDGEEIDSRLWDAFCGDKY